MFRAAHDSAPQPSTGKANGHASGPRSIFKPMTEGRRRGVLVAIEGLDGCGKSTVAHALATLRPDGRQPTLSNWNDTVEIYNLMMRLNVGGDLTQRERCLFSSMDLAARTHYVIRPALERGDTVIVTKYVASALAHSLVRGHEPDFLQRLYAFAVEPDLTLYLDVSPEVALERKAGKIGFWEAGLDVALDLPLAEALALYASGRLPAEYVAEAFLSFQHRLAEHHRELIQNAEVVRIAADAPPGEVIGRAAAAVAAVRARRSRLAVSHSAGAARSSE